MFKGHNKHDQHAQLRLAFGNALADCVCEMKASCRGNRGVETKHVKLYVWSKLQAVILFLTTCFCCIFGVHFRVRQTQSGFVVGAGVRFVFSLV